MERWQKILLSPGPTLAEVARRFELPLEELERVAEAFRFRVTPCYYALIREKGDGVCRQCIPDAAELAPSPELEIDPLGEETHAPAPNVVQEIRFPQL